MSRHGTNRQPTNGGFRCGIVRANPRWHARLRARGGVQYSDTIMSVLLWGGFPWCSWSHKILIWGTPYSPIFDMENRDLAVSCRCYCTRHKPATEPRRREGLIILWLSTSPHVRGNRNRIFGKAPDPRVTIPVSCLRRATTLTLRAARWVPDLTK